MFSSTSTFLSLDPSLQILTIYHGMKTRFKWPCGNLHCLQICLISLLHCKFKICLILHRSLKICSISQCSLKICKLLHSNLRICLMLHCSLKICYLVQTILKYFIFTFYSNSNVNFLVHTPCINLFTSITLYKK